ncbi:MAG: DUF5658 family protein [Gammaproteobacteria bacterium]
MSTERRQQTLISILYGACRPRRSYNRRVEDDQFFIPDLHDTGLFLLGLGIILMSALDAFFTLNIIAAGGEELNLAMKVLLEMDTQTFLLVKYWVTSLSVVCLIAMSRMKFMGMLKVRNIIYAVAGMYGCLMIYEVYLLVVKISILSV